MTPIKMPVPEHSLRHREETFIPISKTNVCHLHTRNVASNPGAPDVVPKASASIRATGTTGRKDAAAAVGIAIAAMPIEETTLEIDIAMTAALRCALDGTATAALVLAHVLGHAELGHPFGTELSDSWYPHQPHHLSDRRRLTSAKAGLWSGLRRHDVASPHEGGPA